MIRQNQIDGLLEASKHNLVAGLIINFRNEYNDTFFITIDEFIDMTSSLNKKSFNVKDLESIGAIRIESTKKRTRHTYNIENLVKETHLISKKEQTAKSVPMYKKCMCYIVIILYFVMSMYFSTNDVACHTGSIASSYTLEPSG